ncbi:toll/interleukin-1 receptor domain-containing protein [Phenylobacterium sp.]|uniref:toll/interleukin-1 receptor domain-containing protein n=1 Tax=Phenylobacterium sp. TaxID=1871053 RepID=UPI0025E3B39B|nr:toll/interleukin-1 receptor domain-containing protein [Phenylobacterium sp.]
MSGRRRAFDLINAGAPIAAAVLGLLGALAQFASDTAFNEAALAAVVTAVTVAIGALSLYIARASKRLSHHPRVFISYSFENKDEARKVSQALEGRGAVVWFDENALKPGDDLHASIRSAIESSNSVVAMLSSRVGEHALRELREAAARHVPVFAILSPDTEKAAVLANLPNISVLSVSDPEAIASAVLAGR